MPIAEHRGVQRPIHDSEKTQKIPMKIEVTEEEAAIITQLRGLLEDEMIAAGIVESCSKKIEYEDGHVLELTWHKQNPDEPFDEESS
jgi:hypothetical protein